MGKYKIPGFAWVSRLQHPLLPAHAITAHRVQGSTLDGEVHILLNQEFFAPGMAYVALSRARRLSQLHPGRPLGLLGEVMASREASRPPGRRFVSLGCRRSPPPRGSDHNVRLFHVCVRCVS